MKRSEIEVGKRYSAKVNYTEHVIVDVLEVGVSRSAGYRGGARADGVRVVTVFPWNRYGRMEKAGEEKIIATRDIAFEWTAEHQERRDAREAEAKRTAERVAALQDALLERGIDGKVDARGLHLPARRGRTPARAQRRGGGDRVSQTDPLPRPSGSRCWWLNCPEPATTLVTANDVTRDYCPAHAQQVERYYAAAARWEAKTEHAHG